MDMTGSQRIGAPQAEVWAALNDPEVLRQCIPGCETIERLADNELQAKVRLKIGPVSASFSGKVTLSDLDPPNGYTITGEGSGGAAGFAKGGATVKLAAIENGAATQLDYTVKSEVGGKIAQLGGRLIDSTGRKLAGDFFAKLDALLAPQPAAETVAEAAAAGDAAPAAVADVQAAPRKAAAPVPSDLARIEGKLDRLTQFAYAGLALGALLVVLQLL